MSELATAPLRAKYATYFRFFCCVVVLLALEMVTRTLHTVSNCSVAYSHPVVSTAGLLIGYEFSSGVVLAVLAMLFVPRELSPFYYMVPADDEEPLLQVANNTAARWGYILYNRNIIGHNSLFSHTFSCIFFILY